MSGLKIAGVDSAIRLDFPADAIPDPAKPAVIEYLQASVRYWQQAYQREKVANIALEARLRAAEDKSDGG